VSSGGGHVAPATCCVWGRNPGGYQGVQPAGWATVTRRGRDGRPSRTGTVDQAPRQGMAVSVKDIGRPSQVRAEEGRDH